MENPSIDLLGLRASKAGTKNVAAPLLTYFYEPPNPKQTLNPINPINPIKPIISPISPYEPYKPQKHQGTFPRGLSGTRVKGAEKQKPKRCPISSRVSGFGVLGFVM